MKCLIVDDERFAREVLSVLIHKSSGLQLAGQFCNAVDAIKYLNEDNEVDLIFLDIHMPNFSGFDFIKTIKNPPQVILVTTDKDFAIEAFNYDCVVDYLVKPIMKERFDRALQRTKSKIKPTTPVTKSALKEIYVNIDKRLVKIEIATIRYVQACGDYSIIKTDKATYTVHTTLKKIEQCLPDSHFLKPHRSYIINLNKIIDIQDSTILIGKDIIPISRRNRMNLMNSLNLL